MAGPVSTDLRKRGRCKSLLTDVRFKLYGSYFLSTWGVRMWAFGLSLGMGAIGGNLQYTAASALVNSGTILIFASAVGTRIDKTPRLKAARTTLLINNSATALSATILVLLLFFGNEIKPIWNGHLKLLLIWLSIIICACSVLANVGTTICITKDWVVVISGNDPEKLANMNAMMVRIDMIATVLSPLLAGQVMASVGTGWGCAFIGLWNVGSFVVEYYMLWAIFKSCPELPLKTNQEVSKAAENACHKQRKTSRYNRLRSAGKTALDSTISCYRVYFRQSIMAAGISLACLYLNVVSFDGNTLVYLATIGMPANWIAICQGLGALMGIVGSLLYPRLRRRIGLNRTGFLALTMEWICLLVAVSSAWLPGSPFDPGSVFDSGNGTTLARQPNSTAGSQNGALGVQNTSLIVFLTGVILSRMGLWMALLVFAQIFQENIAEQERGVVNGVQNSMNNAMIITKSILAIIFPNPATFGLLVIITWIAVMTGHTLFCRYLIKQTGNEPCLSREKRRKCAVFVIEEVRKNEPSAVG